MERVNINTIKKLKEKDIEAFNEVFEAYNDLLYFHALYYVKNECDAQDIVQDIFLRLLRKIHLFNENSSFHTWFMILARNQIYNFIREKRNRKSFCELNEDLVKSYPSDAVYSELPLELDEIKDILGERRFAMLVYRFVHNLTFKEIAKIFNISRETARREVAESVKITKAYKLGKEEWHEE